MKTIKEKKAIKNFYKKQEVTEAYIQDRFETPLGRHMHLFQVKQINKSIKEYNCKKIADIACGPARLDKDVTIFEKAVGLDSSPAMLQLAQKRAPLWQFRMGNAFKTGFKPQEFDMVFSFRFIRHFKYAERKQAYSEMRRIVKKKGIIIFDAVNYDKDYSVRKRVGFDKYPIYDKLFRKKELIAELNKNKLKLIKLVPCINHLYTVTFISKVSLKLKLTRIGFHFIKIIEKIPSRRPLEWIVVCQKK